MSSVSAKQTDAMVEKILRNPRTITLAGASPELALIPARPPTAGRSCQSNGRRDPQPESMPIAARGPGIDRTGRRFRPPEQAPSIAQQSVAVGAQALWPQLEITSAEARDIAESAGLLHVESRCPIIEQRRLGLREPGHTRQ